MLFCHLQNLPRMLYLEPPHSCNVSPLSGIDWSLCLLIRDSGLCLDFRLELIQDRPSSINQSLNRGTKPRHTHTAQFTLVMGFIRYAPYPQTTPNDWTIETVYTFYLQKLTTTDDRRMRKNTTGIVPPRCPRQGESRGQLQTFTGCSPGFKWFKPA